MCCEKKFNVKHTFQIVTKTTDVAAECGDILFQNVGDNPFTLELDSVGIEIAKGCGSPNFNSGSPLGTVTTTFKVVIDSSTKVLIIRSFNQYKEC